MRIQWPITLAVLATLASAGACTPAEADPTPDDESSTGPDSNTTIPLTTVASDAGPPPTQSDSSASDSDTGDQVDGTATSTSSSDDSGTTAALGSSSGDTMGDTMEDTMGDASGSSSDTTTGGAALFVEWCILQFPDQIATAPEVATAVYARVYVEGITDQTQFVDESPLLVAQFGYGADGSMPDDGWAWVDGAANPGWDGTMAKGGFGNENNDEYLADLSFSPAGNYDYAARFSADGGATWVYCDLDDLVNGGYTTDQAGTAIIE
ncbi:MAG: hypothetical protein AAF721_38625 [Myxococcota bacterium]